MSHLYNSYRYPRPSRRRAAPVSWFSCGPTTNSISSNAQKRNNNIATKQTSDKVASASTVVVQVEPMSQDPTSDAETSASERLTESQEVDSPSISTVPASTESSSISDSDSSMSISSPEAPETTLPNFDHGYTYNPYLQYSGSECNDTASYYEHSFYNQYQTSSPRQFSRGSPKSVNTPKPVLVSGGSDLYWRLPHVHQAPVDSKTGTKTYTFEASRNLEDFQTQKEALVALKGAVQALRERWNRVGSAHGDICPRNIRICIRKLEGLGIHAPSGDICEPNLDGLSNLKFKSVLSLTQLAARNEQNEHSNAPSTNQTPTLDYMDDLESVYYTASSVCVEHIGPGSVRPASTIPISFQIWENYALSHDVIEWKKECLLNGPGLEDGEVSAYFGEPFAQMLKEMREMVGDGYRRKMGLPMRVVDSVGEGAQGMNSRKAKKQKNIWNERMSSNKRASPSSPPSLFTDDSSASASEKDFEQFLDIIDRGIKNLQDYFAKNAFQYLDGLEMEKSKYDCGLDEHIFFHI